VVKEVVRVRLVERSRDDGLGGGGLGSRFDGEVVKVNGEDTVVLLEVGRIDAGVRFDDHEELALPDRSVRSKVSSPPSFLRRLVRPFPPRLLLRRRLLDKDFLCILGDLDRPEIVADVNPRILPTRLVDLIPVVDAHLAVIVPLHRFFLPVLRRLGRREDRLVGDEGMLGVCPGLEGVAGSAYSEEGLLEQGWGELTNSVKIFAGGVGVDEGAEMMVELESDGGSVEKEEDM
jgi:hypothetical protein